MNNSIPLRDRYHHHRNRLSIALNSLYEPAPLSPSLVEPEFSIDQDTSIAAIDQQQQSPVVNTESPTPLAVSKTLAPITKPISPHNTKEAVSFQKLLYKFGVASLASRSGRFNNALIGLSPVGYTVLDDERSHRTPPHEQLKCSDRVPLSTTTSPSSQDKAVKLASSTPDKRKPTMHQTSSRLLRMASDDRPFTRDLKDLFSTLMVSLKLDTHRVRFSKFNYSFTADEAINNLGSLKFSQSNRMPDPKDPSRIVTTTTTTTFSMAKEMARTVCQRFLDARFVEPVDGRLNTQFPMKGSLFHMTPKGIHILQRFCQRNGITAPHIMEIIECSANSMQLVILEREPVTDKLSRDRAIVEVIFRRLIGQDGPNVKTSLSSSDSDSVTEYATGSVGVKMAKERKINDQLYYNTFTGRACVDWLMDCCTTVDRRETIELADMFVEQQLMYPVLEDTAFKQSSPLFFRFQPTKFAIYTLTEKGKRVCGWLKSEKPLITAADGRAIARDSNNARLQNILADPALRLLFREFLCYSLCEENLSFYLDVSTFTRQYRENESNGAFQNMDAVRETLASAYGLYNAFLAPGSPCELNIEHNLRNSLASQMTKAVGDDESMLKSLSEVVALFENAQTSVFKLMSSDSVPKFVRDPKYAGVLQDHELELTTSGHSSHSVNSQGTLTDGSRSRR